MAQGRARGPGQRRVKVPGIAELLRPPAEVPAETGQRSASGREGHSHKITVYLSDTEFLDLERAKLTLRGHGIAVDRGRLGREAFAVLLADLDAEGEASLMVRRLREGH